MLAKVFAIVAYLIGLAGAGVFVAYVVGTGTGYWPRGETKNNQTAIQFNVALIMIFAIQHSGMARQRIKNGLAAIFPRTLERAAYVAASGITLGVLALAWQPLDGEPIWHGPSWIAVISLFALMATGWCGAWGDHLAFVGLRQAWTGNADIRVPLRIDGPYRYVRHPLMLGLLIAIWAQPIMPPELLMLNVGMTIYILIAIHLEERGLVDEFGADYEKYRSDVPVLIPWKWW